MTVSSFSFLIRTPTGKEPIPSELLRHPLLLDAGEKHPTLTMADYFASLQQFITDHRNNFVTSDQPEDPDPVQHYTVCSEKLGAFYHVARVESGIGSKSSAVAINSAVSERGRSLLAKDHLLLGPNLPPALAPYVPRILFFSSGEGEDSFSHLAVEWLEGFYEWHLCSSERSSPEFTVWTDTGGRSLTEAESRSLFRQVASIITLSYDWQSRTFLQQWHHAAGDFIVRPGKDALDVRLITVRAIEPFPFLDGPDLQVKFSSLLLFLIDLSIRMRLDKLDGVGKTVWLDNFIVEETVQGFLIGLAEIGRGMKEACETFLQLLHQFNGDDLLQLSSPLLAAYQEMLSTADLAEVRKNLKDHLACLASCLAEQVPG